MNEERAEPPRPLGAGWRGAVPVPGLVGLLAVLLSIAFTGCGGGRPGGEGGAKAAEARRQLIQTARPERRDFARTQAWFGRVESRQSVPVTALQAGRIEAVQAADGAAVRRFQALFRLGGPAASARRTALEAKASSLEERLRLAAQAVDLERTASDEKLVPRADLLQAQAERSRLGAELASAREDLDRQAHALELTSPAAGTFTRRRVSVGQEVAAGDTLAEIVATGSLRVVATLFPASLEEAAKLAGKVATVEAGEAGQAAPGGALTGTVVRVLPDLTSDGATQVWIEGPELDRHLRPGEAVSGRLRLAVHRQALAVPAGAVVRDDEGRAFVFVAGPKGYEERPVTTGLTADGWVEIASGLAPAGARVVVQGAYELYYRDFAKSFRVAD